ncbi:Tam Trans-aconitate methyltransferase [Pyrenophora tritici-repentis]|nr:Trans-aconitate 2-methyltransferase [Pyrenophora tritici-repentis]KAF7445937.1 Trans-aconitate 2-methyltransferase [Pyrenophora tritici-repentis]KAF7567032.1 Tam, Trans-aconitate methyltransferase [Pyrenophora tritici-repentis]KAG9381646.1 Trans-aconitate 2-methyltransferase [Pyrenophora tritici-repentis]KAI0571818.1 Trans-aconitate 2-methyltransferase [Pyrenophora tritici-repentis]
MATTQEQKDWSANQYLKFNNERTRPVYDLLSQVIPHLSSFPNPRIYDLGCGPGNSTKVILDAFPTARITGMDSSADMLKKASASLPSVEFVTGDLATFKVDQKANLLFSNAVFHWLRHSNRIPTLVTLFQGLSTGGVVAIQVPDNYNEPSHALMRVTASLPDKPWAPFFKDTKIGDLADEERPDLDPIQPPTEFYNALIPHAGGVNVWRTMYHHVLKDARAIVEWVKGTGLQPYLNRIEDEATKQAFLGEYERRLEEAYPKMADGNVLLVYPRLFIVAVRK